MWFSAFCVFCDIPILKIVLCLIQVATYVFLLTIKFSNEKMESLTAEKARANSTTDYYPLHKMKIFIFTNNIQ